MGAHVYTHIWCVNLSVHETVHFFVYVLSVYLFPFVALAYGFVRVGMSSCMLECACVDLWVCVNQWFASACWLEYVPKSVCAYLCLCMCVCVCECLCVCLWVYL